MRQGVVRPRSQMASAATVLSFSIGMQAGVTLVTAALGILAAMTMRAAVNGRLRVSRLSPGRRARGSRGLRAGVRRDCE